MITKENIAGMIEPKQVIDRCCFRINVRIILRQKISNHQHEDQGNVRKCPEPFRVEIQGNFVVWGINAFGVHGDLVC